MSGKSGFGQLVGLTLVALLVLGLAQYIVLALHLQSAERQFRTLVPDYHASGEMEFRKRLASMLRADGFDVKPGDISIDTGGGSGIVKLRLEVTREKRILGFPGRKSAVLVAEVFYDPVL